MSKVSDSQNSLEKEKSNSYQGDKKMAATKGNCFYRAWIGWIRICRAISDFIEKIFEKHTRFITKHHSRVMIACFAFVALSAIGAVWFTALQRNEELFIPQGSEAFKKLDQAKEYFKDIKFRVQDIILARSDNTNILGDEELFRKAATLHDSIMDSGYNNDKICLKSAGGGCMVVSVLQVFNFAASEIHASNMTDQINSWLKDPSKLFENGRPAELNYPNILGKYEARTVSDVPRNYTEAVLARALRLSYYTRYADTSNNFYDGIIDWEDKLITLCGKEKDNLEKVGIKMDYFAGRTRDDAILASTVGDLPLFSVAFILMVAFCLLVFFRWKNKVTGHLTVAICGICVIMLGVACGFGISMWIQTDFVAFTGILMFLILGIGMDNMFIIVEALESVDPDIQGEERLVIAMKHIGGSITMTTSTDLVAFAISTVSDFPAVHMFCVYAALSIVFAYLMLITLFLAILTWDIHRIEKGKPDICACRKPIEEARGQNPWLKEKEDISKRALRKWGEILMKTPMKIIVFLSACGLLAAGVYGTTQITQKFEWKKLSRDGSYFRSYTDARDTKFPAGYDVSVILPADGTSGFNYTTEEAQLKILDLNHIAGNNTRFESMTINWIEQYRGWASQVGKTVTGAGFYDNLKDFLAFAPMFKTDVKYTPESGTPTKIISSRVVFFYENNNDALNQAEAMKSIRVDLQGNSDDNIPAKIDIPEVYPISIMFIYAEQFAAVLDDTLRNLVIAGITILIITLPYLVHPGIVGLVFLGFTSLLFELLGMMAAWDVSLDVIAMIVIIMAIGFSVDYTCHIAHAFMISQEATPEKRVIDALSTMGISVLNGGVSTFLGMLITAFSGAEGFRIFFKMVFGIVVLGLMHGLIFLPVLLSIFVRRDLREDMKEFIKKHDHDEEEHTRDRFAGMSEDEKRRQSINYRHTHEKDDPETKKGETEDYKMHSINQNGGVDKNDPEDVVTHDQPDSTQNKNDNKSNGLENDAYENEGGDNTSNGGVQGTELPVYYNNALAS